MPREIFHSEGVQEEPEKTERREQEIIDRLLSRPEGRCSPEMQEILDKIDFEKLNNNTIQLHYKIIK